MNNTLYYEDVVIGEEYISPGRTVTEADHTMFNMLSGDWNPIHADAEYARGSPFGQRLVAGVFGLALTMGAFNRWGIFEESALALLNLREWNFKSPIFINDTIYVTMQFTGKRLTSNDKRGLVQRKVRLLNQRDEVVQEGYTDMLIMLRPL